MNIFMDDTNQLPYYGAMVASMLLLLFVCIMAHELGHTLFFRLIKKKQIKLRFVYKNIWDIRWKAGEQEDYDALTDQEYIAVNWWGISAGLIPIIISGLIYFPSFLMIVPYLVGCKNDIIEATKHED